MNDVMQMDPEYKQLIRQLKGRVVSARTRAMLAVNAQQIKLYWEIGKTILDRQKRSSWGLKLLEQISDDLTNLFPDMKGFSRRNLFLMRQLAQIYPEDEFVQQPVAQLPWGHICLLIQKIKAVKLYSVYFQCPYYRSLAFILFLKKNHTV